MLELTTLMIFTWLTLRVRYFHNYFKDFVLFDIDINNNVIVRWLCSFIMTNDPATNQKSTRQSSTIPTMDSFLNMKQSKSNLCSATNPLTPNNLMQFIENIPIDSSSKPHPRSGHRAVATESDLWIWGGYYPSSDTEQERMFQELWRYNFALRQWTLEQTTGDGPILTLASHSMCLFRNYLLVFGGTGFPFGHHVSNDLFVLDLKRRHWKRFRIHDQQPQPVYGASMLLNDDHLYILCGTNSWIYNSDVFDIHLPTLKCKHIGNTFDEIEDPSETGRYRQEAYLHKNQIFLFGGGGVSGISYSFEHLPVFDLATQHWSYVHTNPDPVHNFPTARKFHSIFPFHNNQVIMFGGAHFNRTTNRHIVVNDRLWIFNFEKLEWSILSSLTMPRPTYFHAAAMNERGEIWTHGGVVVESRSNDNNNIHYNETRITTLYAMHTRVPNLSELAWNYFLNSLPDRTCLIKQPKLMTQLHIPPRFIERIH
ncbi:unnamed protein product [Adineta steineri]|uniref:Uncharacterized protein n=1 Tax=Adineta steineri TaxID=433720 RepID=A0A814BPX5_9BILA|nr:unnamed protein product [Adineta steineri]CAF0874841.1 unnamed protein product [Adineta steineri]CAF0929816.1 unnamed protein product [Adineta steineri]CAF3659164.1 unnamed protein product [Adineta steineri]